MSMAQERVDDVWEEWQQAVNMTAKDVSDWLETPESKGVGDKGGSGESAGHESGRRIVELLDKKKSDLDEEDAAHMRKVVGYVHRHLAQWRRAT